MKIWKVIGQIAVVFVIAALMWIAAGFIMAMIALSCGVVAICLLEINDMILKDKKLKLVEVREAKLYQGNKGAICLDNRSRMYKVGCDVYALTHNYYKRSILKKAYGTTLHMTIETIVQVVEEGETPYVEIYEWRHKGIFRKKVYKRYNVVIPINSTKNY